MKVQGNRTIAGSKPEQVLASLNDPDLLQRVLPGCRELRPDGADAYLMTMEAGVGAIKGLFEGRVELLDSPPDTFAARLQAESLSGTVDAQMTARLRGVGSDTEVDYGLSAQLSGPVAAVGQRVVAGVTRKNLNELFDRLEVELSPRAPDTQADEPARRAAPAPSSGGIPAPTWVLMGVGIGVAIGISGLLAARLGGRS